jgi:hypothetical protein
MARSVTRDTLGAWLIKARPEPGSEVVGLIAAGGGTITSRCVSRGYRADLMAPGDRVLLWVSGDGRRTTRGVWGVGRVTGPVEDGAVPLDLPLLPEPIAAGELLAAGIDDLEVQRMPQGSNPSWVSADQLAALERLLP